jgi:hypothetical protein
MISRPVVVAVVLALPACTSDQGGYVTLAPEPYGETKAGIELGAAVEVRAGAGVRLGVEAPAAGKWRLRATGDYATSRLTRAWDLVVSMEEGEDLAVEERASLEEEDVVRRIDDGAFRLVLFTGDGDAPAVPGDSGAPAPDAASPADASVPSDAAAPALDAAPAGAGESGVLVGGDVDELTFSAPSGRPLRLDVIIDQFHDASYVRWVGDGTVLYPSIPIEFTPITP